MHTTIAILLFACLIIGYLGRHRKMGFWGYFFGSILFTPLVGLILVAASGPKQQD
jgi:uncharacterized membrane protein